jgi:hypothetical protein
MAMSLMLVLALITAALPIDATKISVSAPMTIVEIDTGRLKGDLVRLAWAPDGTQLYLQTAEPDTRGNVKLRHFTVGLDGSAPRSVDAEPPWATLYWSWKSAQSAPGVTALTIQVDQQTKRVNTTSAPAGGDMAKGGLGSGTGGGSGGAGGMSTGEAVGAAYQSQNATVMTLKLKGEIVGQFVNAPALPGTTFGWGPSGSGLIAFVRTGDRADLVIMDDQNRKCEIGATRAALLPAWTADGRKLAYLEKTGRKKVTLKIVDISIPRT